MESKYKYPAAIEEERGLLAGMVFNDGAAIPEVSAIMREDDFYRPEHRTLYRHIVKLHSEGVIPNLITLRTSLMKAGNLNPDTVSAMFSIFDLSFTTAYNSAYIKRVKETANLRRLLDFGKQLAESATDSNRLTVDGLIDKLKKVTDVVEKNNEDGKVKNLRTLNEYIDKDFFDEIEATKAYANRMTGFSTIDENQLFTPGLYVLGGLPALGKTTFAWQLLNNLAAQGEKCIYCSYEMSMREMFVKRVASDMFKADRYTTLTGSQILRGASSDLLLQITKNLRRSTDDISVLELRDETVDDLLKILRLVCAKTPRPPIVCLDYLQIIPHAQENPKAGIDAIVRKLKLFQQETNTTFIVISSFNRLNYLQSVSFESFKESGNIEYTADVVWGLQLACMANVSGKDMQKARAIIEQAKRDHPRKIQLCCLKNRRGANYDCYLDYYSAHDHFEVNEDDVNARFAEIDDVPNGDIPIDDDDSEED